MFKKPLHLYVSTSTWCALVGSRMGSAMSDTFAGTAEATGAMTEGLVAQLGDSYQVSLVLSARHCRFIALPWLSSCYTGRSIKKYVSEAIAEQLDGGADSHHVEVTWPRFGETITAVAYPRELVEGLKTGLSQGGYELRAVMSSVQPVFQSTRARIGSSNALLAYAEDDGITAITTENGSIVQVENLSGSGVGVDQLEIWCSRKRFSFAADEDMFWLSSAEKPSAFHGKSLSLEAIEMPKSAGHGVLSTCF